MKTIIKIIGKVLGIFISKYEGEKWHMTMGNILNRSFAWINDQNEILNIVSVDTVHGKDNTFSPAITPARVSRSTQSAPTITVDYNTCKVNSIIRASVPSWEQSVDSYNQARVCGVFFTIVPMDDVEIRAQSEWSIDFYVPRWATTIIVNACYYYYDEFDVIQLGQIGTKDITVNLTGTTYTRPIPDSLSDGVIYGNQEISSGYTTYIFKGTNPINAINYKWQYIYGDLEGGDPRQIISGGISCVINWSGNHGTGVLRVLPVNDWGVAEGGKELPIVSGLTKAIPTMTSNTAPSGTAACSSKYGTPYDVWKAMDKQTTCWVSAMASMPQWISYEFTSAKEIYGYKLKPQNYPYRDRNPMSWNFQYWEIDCWRTLHSVASSVEGDWYDNTTPRVRAFGCHVTATKFRLYINTNNGGDVVSIDEFDIFTY